jgi:hypothetical protein
MSKKWLLVGLALYVASWFAPAFRDIPIEFGTGWRHGWEAFLLCLLFAIVGWGSLGLRVFGAALVVVNLAMLLVLATVTTQWLDKHARWLWAILAAGAALATLCLMVIATQGKAGVGCFLWAAGIAMVFIDLVVRWAAFKDECTLGVPPN